MTNIKLSKEGRLLSIDDEGYEKKSNYELTGYPRANTYVSKCALVCFQISGSSNWTDRGP